MGGVHSTRTISLANDEKDGVIQLSEGLVHRLQGQFEKGETAKGTSEPRKPAYSPPPQYIPQPSPEPSPMPEEMESISLPEDHDSNRMKGNQQHHIPPWSAYTGDVHLMATKLKEEKRQELKARDDHWRKKLQDMEKEYTSMNQLKEEQLEASIREVESFFMKVSRTPVCQEQQDGVLSCYRSNPNQSLRCGQQVEAMARCADLSRLKVGTTQVS